MIEVKRVIITEGELESIKTEYFMKGLVEGKARILVKLKELLFEEAEKK